ncbi:hypothetical protein ACJMK2_010722 [Sinanodonta woodiana]|uniref:Uncharacterized protein n=1 Tax=Sinanodonta woodiana TaxID=1069815 RepID=A0ABD3VHJ3_SINWO
MDVPDYYEAVSVKLVKLLDKSGYGNKAQWKRIEMWIQFEKLLNNSYACHEQQKRTHIFGSQAEATDMGIKSDDLQSWEPGLNTLLMITDSTTLPGYVKLQGVYNDEPIPVYDQQTKTFMFDAYGRSVLYNGHRYVKREEADTHHGPANTNNYGLGFSADTVFAERVL